MFWRFSVNHTHLYPGALMRSLDVAHKVTWMPGEDVQVEFSDGVLACGQVLRADATVLHVPAQTIRYARQTQVVRVIAVRACSRSPEQ